MRTLLFTATLVTAVLIPVGQASAQCCGAAQPAVAAQADHSAHGAPAAPALAPAAPGTPAMACCGAHTQAAPAAAPPAKACCGGAMAAAPAKKSCCDHGAASAPAALLPADDPAIALAGLGLTPTPAVRYMDVTFRDPVRVGDVTLMGAYLIEHDDDRMARGEPCTYIYDVNDLRAPVVTFHCEHLERPLTPNASVVLAPTFNSPTKVMKEFQFGNETAAHGVPGVR